MINFVQSRHLEAIDRAAMELAAVLHTACAGKQALPALLVALQRLTEQAHQVCIVDDKKKPPS